MLFYILYLHKSCILILSIETSTKNCSVSLSDSGKLIDVIEQNNDNYSHAELLHVFIDKILEKNNIQKNQLNAVAISKGPGSYTGLRIGVSAAKGLCFALDIPLIAIDTLKILASQIQVNNALIVPMIDARRLEVYTCIFDKNLKLIEGVDAKIINQDSFKNYLENYQLYFLGDGAAKCKPILQHSNANFIEDEYPSAKNMGMFAFEKYKKYEFEDVAYFEPYYLKDFIAIPEKNKLFFIHYNSVRIRNFYTCFI
ncbi:MAG: tRNA (adenosine(37)-N6)-threonylcarbamoyltransferase complex dimerization subunit type 1 TsaB [Polaribacter sp.]|nr:tRNA (adenosine(37)-N6)-threonylcarbamoyltransferase complex dimerization subunit type 1 TsaB [Polaribacter sp.]